MDFRGSNQPIELYCDKPIDPRELEVKCTNPSMASPISILTQRDWCAGQPRGVTVEGTVGITMDIPQLDGSYDYIPGNIRYVFIMGYNADREVIEPVGIGEIVNHQVRSIGQVALPTLDFVGYAWVHPDFQTKLESVANGRLSLQQLISELQQ